MKALRTTCLLLLVVALCAAALAGRAEAQASGQVDFAAQLARAEQLFDEANYRSAAAMLRPIVDDASAVGRSERVAAARLLAQVYHRSADYAQAAAMADLHARLVPADDPQMRLIEADAYTALGRRVDAQRQLEAFRLALAKSPLSSLQRARLESDAQPIAATLGDAAAQSSPDAPDPSGAQAAGKVAPEQLESSERYQAVNWLIDRHSAAEQFHEAAALLTREVASPAYEAHQQAELALRLAECYQRQASQLADSGNTAGHRQALNGARQALESLSHNLRRRRALLRPSRAAAPSAGDRAEPENSLAWLLWQEARMHELLAELARSEATPKDKELAEKQLLRAERRYRQLAQLAAPSAALVSMHDAALCGLQRVYDAQRLAAGGAARGDALDNLCAVSDQLVAARTARLLETDPALYEARRARAAVYASRDDQAGYARAEALYRELIAFWQTSPHSDFDAHAAALVGLAEVLRSLDKTRDAHAAALQAQRLLGGAPRAQNAEAQRARALLAARIENSLAVSSIALGQYRDALQYLAAADRRLKPYGPSAEELRHKNQQALHVLSRTKVYRGLLHKAEAQFGEAAARVREGRRLREQLDDDADLIAYYLAEASVHLAQARALIHARGAKSGDAMMSLDSAEAALNNAQPLVERRHDSTEPRHTAAALPYRYLRALLARLRGEADASRQAFATLAEDSLRYGDRKMAAMCYSQLAQLAAGTAASAPTADRLAPPSDERPIVARAEAKQLLQHKLDRREALLDAARHAAQAVALFKQMEQAVRDEQSGEALSATALPSLHFQAAYLAARLHVLLAALDEHVLRLQELLAAPPSAAPEIRPAVFTPQSVVPSDHAQAAIEFLEDAVTQAELPASSTTQVRLQRAKFFSRYAPAYDLLVDLHVAAAAAGADRLRAAEGSDAFAHLRRAIEVADLARNRTFREQIDGWREASGGETSSRAFDWQHGMARLAERGIAVLVYHLDGPQLLDATSGQLEAAGRIGGGHLFVVRAGGKQLEYHRLQYQAPATSQPTDLTRPLAADLVRRHIAWIERPDAAREWGRAEQRALTNALLPRELLVSLTTSSEAAPTAPARQLLIVPDGALHQLPFESLLLPAEVVGGAAIRYVLDALPPIRYGPSLSVLAALGRGAGQGGNAPPRLLTVGNPAYPAPDHQAEIPAWDALFRQMPTYRAGFGPLVHSVEECLAVYASFDELPEARRLQLLGGEATESAVRDALAACRFVHLAAHGCVDYQNDNLYGALLFAPGTDLRDARDDGILQLRDIYGIDLSGCELAVLSACQTYVGPERPLEAGTSMARAFLEQGARRVVCSQWSTDDEATTEFMKVFFKSLRAARQAGDAVDYALALHKAKQAIRADPQRGSLPRFWSPFVLVGAP